ncbi:MAG: hypothetical protein KBT44_01280 [Bacteroidales bacterium]|nr:hypothetical protein [Candidatus Equibacterium intestinale]
MKKTLLVIAAMFALVISANAQAKFGVQGAMSLAKMANGGSGESILSWQAGVVFDYDFQSNLYLSTGRSLRRILHRCSMVFLNQPAILLKGRPRRAALLFYRK